MRHFIERDLQRLTALIYDAALDPARWQFLLNALSPIFAGANGILHMQSGTDGPLSFQGFGNDPVFATSYANYYAGTNPYPPQGFANIRVGTTIYATAFLAREAVETTEFYHDWMKPQGITADHLGLSLQNDDGWVTVLSVAPQAVVYRRDRDLYRRRLDILAPHLLRAVALSRRLANAEHRAALVTASVEAFGAAIIMVDRSSGVLRLSTAAEACVCEVGSAVTIDRNRTLKANVSSADNALTSAIKLACDTGNSSGPFRLEAKTSSKSMLAWVLSAPRISGQTAAGIISHLADSASQSVALVLLTPLDPAPVISPDAIAAAFRLSPAEARLISGLIAGETLESYSARVGLSRNTARNQLSRAFERTDTTRQAELVARVIAALRPALR